MGFALAEAALASGHSVTLISGPVSLTPPPKAKLIQVETAQEMRRAVLREAPRARIIIMAAAVADYEPISIARQKLKKKDSLLILKLRKTPDILKELGDKKNASQILVGFAAETTQLLKNARAKLRAKKLDCIVANKVGGRDSPFDSDFNQVIILQVHGKDLRLPRMPKKQLARRLIGFCLQRASCK